MPEWLEWSATITGVTTLMPDRRRITPQLRPTTPTVSTHAVFSFLLIAYAFLSLSRSHSFLALFSRSLLVFLSVFPPERLSSRFNDRHFFEKLSEVEIKRREDSRGERERERGRGPYLLLAVDTVLLLRG